MGIGHLGPGQVTLGNGVISGLFCWLVVLVLMGAIIGAMGV